MGKLTARFCASVRPAATVTSHGDGRGGHGLRLRVMPNGSKNWYQTVRLHDRGVNLGLGGFPEVSLPEARLIAVQNYVKAKAGRDPRQNVRQGGAQRTGPRSETLGEYMDQVIRARRSRWKDPRTMESHWRGSLKHASPLLVMPVSEVTPGVALNVLEPMMLTRPTVALQLRSRLAEALDRAVIDGLRPDNPFKTIARHLVVPRGSNRNHHKALPYADVPAAVAKLVAMDSPCTLALAFQILTAVRPGEALGARRSEVVGDVWTIPASRMKAGREHRVPLSAPALGILARAHSLATGELVFPAPRGGTLHPARASKTVREMGIGGTPHGFRSSFRDWCAETGKPRELAEAALAHTVAGVEGSYFRSDLFERRRTLMDSWGEYVTTTTEEPSQ